MTNKVTKKLPVTKQMTKRAPAVTKKNHPQVAPNLMIQMKSQEKERTKEIMDFMNTTDQFCLRMNNVEKGMVSQKKRNTDGVTLIFPGTVKLGSKVHIF